VIDDHGAALLGVTAAHRLLKAAATLLLYDLAVRRTRVTGFLFGLRPGQP
jgi:hypothetical protein